MVECPGCGKRYRVERGPTARKLRCKACGEVFVLPAQEMSDEAFDAELGVDAPSDDRARPVAATIAGWASVLLGLVAVPLVVLMSFGVVAFAEYRLPTVGLAGISLMMIIEITLIVAAVGLLTGRTWGWWAGAMGHVFGGAFYVKMCLPVLLRVKWSHPDAIDAVMPAVVFYGIPALLFLGVAGLLFLSPVRIAYGVKDRPRERRRRVVGTPKRRAART